MSTTVEHFAVVVGLPISRCGKTLLVDRKLLGMHLRVTLAALPFNFYQNRYLRHYY